MNDYLNSITFGTLFKSFVKYFNIQNKDIVKYCNIDMERIPYLYLVEDLSKVRYEELESLNRLISIFNYDEEDMFNNIRNDDEACALSILKRLSYLINQERVRRLTLIESVQRKRGN